MNSIKFTAAKNCLRDEKLLNKYTLTLSESFTYRFVFEVAAFGINGS